MKRDKFLARRILEILIRDCEGAGLLRSEIRNACDEDEANGVLKTEKLWDRIDYHLDLLETAGFIARQKDDEGNNDDDIYTMTWAGHDYIE